MVVGAVAEGVAWWFVAVRRASVWAVLTPVLAAMGLLALIVAPPSWSPDAGAGVALAAGLGAGLVLYAGTRVFVTFAGRSRRFERDAVGSYLRRGSVSLGAALLLSMALAVPGEELFWRGLARTELIEALDGRSGTAAVAAWLLSVVANLPSANLAIVAGAVVGGAVWTALAWWSGGILASLACHALWTGLMLGFPAVAVREEAA